MVEQHNLLQLVAGRPFAGPAAYALEERSVHSCCFSFEMRSPHEGNESIEKRLRHENKEVKVKVKSGQ